MACWGEAAGGALSGAGTGAVIGSVVPGLGTAVGAVAGGVVGGVAGLLSGKCKPSKDEVEFINRQATAHNIYARDYKNYADYAMAALKAGGYDPYGPQITTRVGETNTKGYSNTQTQQRPVITPEYKALEAKFRGLAQDRLNKPSALPAGYAQTGLMNINRAAAPAVQAEKNLAARQNRAYTGVGSPGERERQYQSAAFTTGLPLLERDMRTQDIGLASGLAQTFGLGQDTNTQNQYGSRQTDTATITAPPNYTDAINAFGPQGPAAPWYGKRDMKDPNYRAYLAAGGSPV